MNCYRDTEPAKPLDEKLRLFFRLPLDAPLPKASIITQYTPRLTTIASHTLASQYKIQRLGLSVSIQRTTFTGVRLIMSSQRYERVRLQNDPKHALHSMRYDGAEFGS